MWTPEFRVHLSRLLNPFREEPPLGLLPFSAPVHTCVRTEQVSQDPRVSGGSSVTYQGDRKGRLGPPVGLGDWV